MQELVEEIMFRRWLNRRFATPPVTTADRLALSAAAVAHLRTFPGTEQVVPALEDDDAPRTYLPPTRAHRADPRGMQTSGRAWFGERPRRGTA